MLSIPPNASGAASMAPIDGAASSGLCILPNLEMNRINFPHETETDGTLILGKTVRTIVRVGLLRSGLPPTASKRLIMSLHDGSGEITANRVTTGKPMYNDSSNALKQEMRPEVPPQPDLDPMGSGVERAACVAEATFDFKFSVTASQVHGNSTNTPVWLRFTVEGSPDLYVDTPHFRLVAKKDKRESVATLMMSALKSTKQVPCREGSSPRPSSDPAPSANLNPQPHANPNPNPSRRAPNLTPTPKKVSAALDKAAAKPPTDVNQQILNEARGCVAAHAHTHIAARWTT